MLQLITLNAWGGRVKSILDFISNNKDVNFFCFQEIYNGPPNYLEQGGLATNVNLYSDIGKTLPEHKGYFRSQYNDNFGLASFVDRQLNLENEDEIYIYREKGYKSDSEVANHGRNLQSLHLSIEGKKLNIFNLHGLWTGINKSDTPERLEQSKRTVDYMNNFDGAKILCGDFNLLPDTQSLKIIEETGMRNMITENNITSTRTSYYKKSVPFADYIFVNDEIDVRNFEVMEEEVSDHAALKLGFELR